MLHCLPDNNQDGRDDNDDNDDEDYPSPCKPVQACSGGELSGARVKSKQTFPVFSLNLDFDYNLSFPNGSALRRSGKKED